MASKHSDQIKAHVIADFAMGMSKSAIAKKHDLPRTTVNTWLSSHESPVSSVTDTQKRDELGELVYEYLATGLSTLIAQARAMGDAEWFKGQVGATHLIHGTLADKLVVIFAGVERGQPEPGDPDEQAG